MPFIVADAQHERTPETTFGIHPDLATKAPDPVLTLLVRILDPVDEVKSKNGPEAAF